MYIAIFHDHKTRGGNTTTKTIDKFVIKVSTALIKHFLTILVR